MEYDAGGPLLKVLLLIGGNSSATKSRSELLPYPDGRLTFEHALDTLHSAVPSASTIYISLHDEIKFANIEGTINDIVARAAFHAEHDEHKHPHTRTTIPKLKPILDQQDEDIGPAAGLLTAHLVHIDTKWLVLSCDYPLLPASALQQLILEYQSPVTCFMNESGIAQPLIGIWSTEALEKLKENVRNGKNALTGVVEEMKGRLVKQLREQWITHMNTKEYWNDAMDVLAWRGD